MSSKKNTLQTDKQYIKELFSPASFYNIPDYQRPYVWGKEQIFELLDDIWEASKNRAKEYFLGCMIWNTKEILNDNYEFQYRCHDILDGQQRFLTLYMLMGVLRDVLPANKTELLNKLQMYLVQPSDPTEQIPNRNRIVFEVRNDNEFFETHLFPKGATNTLTIKNIPRDKETSFTAMYYAVCHMHSWFKLKAKEKKEYFEGDLLGFTLYLINNVLILYLATPDNLDNAYNLFTVLNSRGLQLQASDIIKAQNLRAVENEKERKEFALKWVEYEKKIQEPYPSLDSFLHTIVVIKNKYQGEETKQLTKAFEFLADTKKLAQGRDFFEYVQKCLITFETFRNIKLENEAEKNLFQNLFTIVSHRCPPIFLAALIHYYNNFQNYRILEFFIKLDNILSAYWIGSKDLTIKVFQILRKMDEEISLKKSLTETAIGIIDGLDYDNQNNNILTQLISELNEDNWGNASGTRMDKIVYILLKYNLLLSDKYNKLEYNREQTSVEHIIPRTINKMDWPEIDPQSEVYGNWVHRLGNLVLLNRKKNSAISNSSFKVKKEKYAEAIENNPHASSIFLKNEVWTLDKVQENHERVIKLLQKYYEGNSLQTLLNLHKR